MEAFLVLGILGALLGFGLVVASMVFYVKEDNRVVDVTNFLPGYNCGACGKPGCNGFAEAIISGEVTSLSVCKPAKDDHFDKILKYLESATGDFKKVKK